MAKVQSIADRATAAATKMGARVRMTEGNTCYRGGKPGVSDVFAAALWAADYSLLLAASNYSGINLHGGTAPIITSGLGGVMFGDEVLKAEGATPEQIASHPHPYYAPIASFGSDYILEPVAYGLKFVGSFSGGSLIKTDFTSKLQAAGVNASAYAAKLAGGQTSVIVLNKDTENDLALEPGFRRCQIRQQWRSKLCTRHQSTAVRLISRDQQHPAISRTESLTCSFPAHPAFASPSFD